MGRGWKEGSCKGASIRYDHTGGMPKRIVLELSYRGFVNLRASGIGGVKKKTKIVRTYFMEEPPDGKWRAAQ